jgi:hypothetical protein
MGTQIKSDGGCFYIGYLFGPIGYLKGGGGYCYKKYGTPDRVQNILRRYKKYGTPDRVGDTECKGYPPPFVVVLGGWVSCQNDN